jgi:hypothetical protein
MIRIPVALFSDRTRAESIQKRLCGAGIRAEIHDELRLEKLWFVSKKKEGGLRIEVPADQFEQAEGLLLNWDITEGVMREAIRCPECKSLRVDYPQFTRKSLLTNLAVGLAAEVGVVEKQYYCQDCHFTWPREGTKPRPDRPHLAPYYFIEGVEQTAARTLQTEHRRAV